MIIIINYIICFILLYSPANGAASQTAQATIGNDTPACPVCFSTSFKSNDELTAHIEEHFSKKCTPSPITPDLSTDRMLAKDMERLEKELRKLREQREFELLRAQYGMDNQGNFREQSVTNMQRAVYSGEMTIADYYERQTELRVAESSGIDDGSSCTRGNNFFFFFKYSFIILRIFFVININIYIIICYRISSQNTSCQSSM